MGPSNLIISLFHFYLSFEDDAVDTWRKHRYHSGDPDIPRLPVSLRCPSEPWHKTRSGDLVWGSAREAQVCWLCSCVLYMLRVVDTIDVVCMCMFVWHQSAGGVQMYRCFGIFKCEYVMSTWCEWVCFDVCLHVCLCPSRFVTVYAFYLHRLKNG